MRVGVVAVQGAFAEHEGLLEAVFEAKGVKGRVVQVRTPKEAASCDGFVLPGGESTTMDKLLGANGLRGALLERVESGVPVLATCAGAILLSSRGDEQVDRTGTRLLGVLDVEVERNAFGRQRESFEAGVRVEGFGDSFPGVFIRAPLFRRVWGRARPWAWLDDRVVGVKQGSVVALVFHPELSGDPRVHAGFVDRVLSGA